MCGRGLQNDGEQQSMSTLRSRLLEYQKYLEDSFFAFSDQNSEASARTNLVLYSGADIPLPGEPRTTLCPRK